MLGDLIEPHVMTLPDAFGSGLDDALDERWMTASPPYC